MDRLLVIALIILSIHITSSPLYGASQMPEYLCEIGIKFYQQGRHQEALHEFKKALLIQPNYQPALLYIRMIEQVQAKPLVPTPLQAPRIPISEITIAPVKEGIEFYQLEREIIMLRQLSMPIISKTIPPRPSHEPLPGSVSLGAKKFISLDASLEKVPQPIQVEKGTSLIVTGKNISRFLITQPDIFTGARQNNDQIILAAQQIGYSYVYFWDDTRRWDMELLGVGRRPPGPTLDELMRQEEERQENFKLRYTLEWHVYEQGRRLGNLERQYYSWSHNLAFTGATPYGDVDANVIARVLHETADVTYFTIGLGNGSWSNFKGFSLRGFDFYPDLSLLIFSGTSSALRGAMLSSPAFDKKIDYTVFWGREGGGRYGNLSPGLQKIKKSYLNGVNVNLHPTDKTDFGVTFMRGSGRDRPDYLNSNAFDVDASWQGDHADIGYEVGYDSQDTAHLLSGSVYHPGLNFSYELRNISKDFMAINGQPWRRGQLGGLFALQVAPNSDWDIGGRLDVYRDRLFPSLDNNTRWNQDYDMYLRYTIDPTTYTRASYILQNDLGTLSQRRYQAPSIGLFKTFNLVRRVQTYLDYRYQQATNYTGHSFDYSNDNISTGIRFSLIGQLYYFLNKQWNWLRETGTGRHFRPSVLETGFDTYGQIGNSPFYETMRFSWHDEEDARSALSFLSGQDYLEGYTELSYRPTSDAELYCSTRLRNVWAEQPDTPKRMEADFYAGVRYLWNTGLRWESRGAIDGYVFRDINGDGLRQRDEAPVSGIKLWLGKNRTATTDIFGYYQFNGVRGRKAFVNLDAQSLPSGFVLTVPATQSAPIVHAQVSRIDFGIVSRLEISGFVFWDANGDGQYNYGDTGIKNAILVLENGVKATTDGQGRFLFRNLSRGEHTITLNLQSLPINYIPQVPLTKKITLSEGDVYTYQIPLKKTSD